MKKILKMYIIFTDRKSLIEGVQSCIFDGKFPEPGTPPTKSLRFKGKDVGIDYVPLVLSLGGFSDKTVGVIKFIADAYAV